MTDGATDDRVAQSAEFNFDAFARDEAYREANRALIAKAFALLPSTFFHVDVATGTGLVPQEVCALCREQGKQGTIIGIDPDAYALESARRHTPAGPSYTVEFVQGVAQDLPQLLAGKIPPEGVDYASIHDAIHEIPGEDVKRGILATMASILKPGGVLTYNSAFTTAAMEQSALEWGRMKAKAIALLGGKRDRHKPAVKIHTPEEYRQMITEAGLEVIYEGKRAVMMTRASLGAIFHYPAFIEGAFSDMIGTEQVPLTEKHRVMMAVIDAMGPIELPRVWHEIMARKAG